MLAVEGSGAIQLAGFPLSEDFTQTLCTESICEAFACHEFLSGFELVMRSAVT